MVAPPAPVGLIASRPPRRIDGRRLPRPGRLLLYLLLVLGAALMMFPFVWMLLTSLKTMQGVNLSPPEILPDDPQWSNYSRAWFAPKSSFGKYFVNSLVVAIVGTAVQLFTGITAAYAFAWLRFRFKNVLFILVVATMMVPFEAKVVPNYVLIRRLPLLGGNDINGVGGSGLYDTYAGMILPGVASAFAVFLLRQAFMTVPRDFWDAVRVDGASHWTFLWRILVPLTRPAIVTVVLFGFLGRYNELLWPLIITQSESIRPVQLGLILFSSDEGQLYHLMMAASAFVALPGIVLFVLVQRRFIEGLSSAGVKG
jgi:multiple sugar transport system permease protein